MEKARIADEAQGRTLGGRSPGSLERSSWSVRTREAKGANGVVAASLRPARGSENGHARNGSTAVVLIASEMAGLRKQWRQAMRGRCAVHEVFESAALERSMASECPGVLLLDLDLPGLDGIGGVDRLRRLQPTARILVLTSRPDEREGVAAVKAGAWGYSDRDIAPALLVKALDVVQNGEIWIGRKLIPLLLEELRGPSEPPPSPRAGSDGGLERLSHRERETARLVGTGACNKEIATALDISERTVKAHLTAAYRKLGISGRLQLALFTFQHS